MDQLLTKFKETEIKYKALKEQLNRGEITAEQAKEEIKRLMIPDDTGTYWMMGGKSGKWYKHVEGQWQDADPYQQFAPPPQPEEQNIFEPQLDAQIQTPQVQEYVQEQVQVEPSVSDAAEVQVEQESVATQENQFDLGGFGQEAQVDGLETGRVEEEQPLFTQEKEQHQDFGGLADSVESNDYSFDDIGLDSTQTAGEKIQVEPAGGFLDTHADLNTVDTNEFVIKGDQQQVFAEKSGDIGINIDLDKELGSGDVGGLDEEFAAQLAREQAQGQAQEEEDDNPFIGQDSGEYSLDNFDQDTREKESDTLQPAQDDTMQESSFGAVPTLDQQSQYGQETFSSRETIVEQTSFADQLDQEESAFQESPTMADTFSLDDSQSLEESSLSPETPTDQALLTPEQKSAAPSPIPSAAGIPAVDFSKYVECVACKSKIQPIAIHCPFCGANQKDFNPKKKKSKKKVDTGTENELVVKSIKVMSFLFFLGGLGIIFGVIFGAIFGVLKDTMLQLHYQLPMMFQEVRGGFVGGLIFAAIGGIGGFVGFAFISLVLSSIYNLISFVFGGIRFKVKG